MASHYFCLLALQPSSHISCRSVIVASVRPAVSHPSSTCTTGALITSWLVKSSRQPCNGHDLIIHSIPISILSNPKFGAIQEASNRLLGADGRDKIGNSRCIDRSDPFRFATLHFYDLISKRGSPRVGLRRVSRVLEDGRPRGPLHGVTHLTALITYTVARERHNPMSAFLLVVGDISCENSYLVIVNC